MQTKDAVFSCRMTVKGMMVTGNYDDGNRNDSPYRVGAVRPPRPVDGGAASVRIPVVAATVTPCLGRYIPGGVPRRPSDYRMPCKRAERMVGSMKKIRCWTTPTALLLLAALAVCTRDPVGTEPEPACAWNGKDSIDYLFSIKCDRDFRRLEGLPLSLVYGEVGAVKIVHDMADDSLYFTDSRKYDLHYTFCRLQLGYPKSHADFNQEQYSDGGELEKIRVPDPGPIPVPEGAFAITFYYYRRHMVRHGLDDTLLFIFPIRRSLPTRPSGKRVLRHFAPR